MIHELRIYDLRPGSAPDYLALFQKQGLGAVTRHLPLAGYWLSESGALNRLYHLWIYADLVERATARAGLAGDSDWNRLFVPHGFPLILRQRNMLMRLVEGGEPIRRAEAGRLRHHANRPGESALFADSMQCLTRGQAAPTEPPLARWQVLSGECSGERIALWQGDGLGFAADCDRHEILRPLACSPLK